ALHLILSIHGSPLCSNHPLKEQRQVVTPAVCRVATDGRFENVQARTCEGLCAIGTSAMHEQWLCAQSCPHGIGSGTATEGLRRNQTESAPAASRWKHAWKHAERGRGWRRCTDPDARTTTPLSGM